MAKNWLAPLALLYGAAISVRHKMFDWGWLHTQEYDIPVICVGNLTVGGTGKTPVTELLAAHFAKRYKIAVLSRGYKRRTKGYLEVQPDTSFLKSGDEPKQIKLKYPEIIVAVCEKRTEGIAKIRENHPDVNLIILDDGFQHRYVKPWVNIVLMDYNRPIFKDHLLPWGTLRDNKSQLHRANAVIVTKCPKDMTAIDRRIIQKTLALYPYQNLYFSSMEQGTTVPIYREEANETVRAGANVIAMAGIGSPEPFIEGLSCRYNVVDSLIYPDHHPYRRKDLDAMRKALDNAPEGTVIVTTEKDSVKLRNGKKIPAELREKLFYQSLRLSFTDDTEREFLNKLDYDIRTNPKDRLLH